MICPRCGGSMVLFRIEYRGAEVVQAYRCLKCGHVLEVSYRFRLIKTVMDDWNPDYIRRGESWVRAQL